MANVALDGENVEFEGDPPGTCREACELIDGYLSGQGLAIDSVSVEGKEIPLEEALGRGAYENISFKSISPQAQLLRMCGQWEQEAVALIAEMDQLAIKALRQGWGDSQTQVIELMERLRPLVEGLGILQNFGQESGASWSGRVSEVLGAALGSIDQVANAVEAADCVALSDQLDLAMSEKWKAVAASLASEVIPVLEAELEA